MNRWVQALLVHVDKSRQSDELWGWDLGLTRVLPSVIGSSTHATCLVDEEATFARLAVCKGPSDDEKARLGGIRIKVGELGGHRYDPFYFPAREIELKAVPRSIEPTVWLLRDRAMTQ